MVINEPARESPGRRQQVTIAHYEDYNYNDTQAKSVVSRGQKLDVGSNRARHGQGRGKAQQISAYVQQGVARALLRSKVAVCNSI